MGIVVPEGVEEVFLAQRSEPRSAEEYAASCAFDFEAMRPFLLEGDVLDIGCGLGGTSVLIAKHCRGRLYLLDGDVMEDGRRTDFGPTMEPYNLRAATEKMLAANGITDYQWWPVGATELPRVRNVVSLISWGWHYPVSTYLEPVRRALPPGGRLILDIRPRTGGEEELRRYFRYVGSYRGFGKCNKTVWQRRPV